MGAPTISDHALVRFLDRAGHLNVEQLRERLGTSLARAHTAARSISTSDYVITVDGKVFVVRGDTVTTVLNKNGPSGGISPLDPNRAHHAHRDEKQ